MLATGIGFYFLAQTISGAMWAVCQEAGGVRGISLPTTLGLHWIARASCELLPANLGEATVDRLLEHTDGAAHLIVLGADIGAAEALGAPVTPTRAGH